jgi:hypothetical protein
LRNDLLLFDFRYMTIRLYEKIWKETFEQQAYNNI